MLEKSSSEQAEPAQAEMPGLEQSLDPQDWGNFRQLAHQMVDDMLEHLATIATRPVWQEMPAATREALTQPLNCQPVGEAAVYQEFCQQVLPYTNGNLHPRFWGWVQGTGMPLAMMADMLAAGINPHMAGFNQAPALVEHQVLECLRTLMQMPVGTSGVLCSGGTMANIVGLTVARQAQAGFNVRQEGLQQQSQPFTVYCSTETHGWAQKAVEVLGIGNKFLRRIPVNNDFQLDLTALGQAVAQDRQAGCQPICVIANVGTVNTGAIDDLPAIADFCQQEKLWFHVDGAFGALAMLSPRLRPLVQGLERADSLAFDLHKWMFLPFEVACILVRDAEMHRSTFALTPSYIAPTSRGIIKGGLPFAERGYELTRGFKALKVWMCLKAYGVDAFVKVIEQNVDQIQYLQQLILQSTTLELLAPVPLNVVCFRYRQADLTPAQLNALNQEILLQLQERGIAAPSGTMINGQYAIRVANVNHRSRRADFTHLVTAICELGAEFAPKFSSI
jgi:aromatic-L-amino-acid/L-tryptophan decarboxylase